MNIGYIRVSTNKQDIDNQKFAIQTFSERNNITIDTWVEETISGTKSPDKRKLGQVLKKAKSGDTIICTELSRLGRSLFMCFDILNFAMSHEINVWTIKENYKLGTDISSALLAFVASFQTVPSEIIFSLTKTPLILYWEFDVKNAISLPPLLFLNNYINYYKERVERNLPTLSNSNNIKK